LAKGLREYVAEEERKAGEIYILRSFKICTSLIMRVIVWRMMMMWAEIAVRMAGRGMRTKFR
jgi:hypothetical protein